MTGLVMNYLENEIGGLENMQKRNAAKAKVLYDYLDGQEFYKNPVEKKYRSMMNVTFTSPDADTDKAFCAAATEAGFVNLKGAPSGGAVCVRPSTTPCLPRASTSWSTLWRSSAGSIELLHSRGRVCPAPTAQNKGNRE